MRNPPSLDSSKAPSRGRGLPEVLLGVDRGPRGDRPAAPPPPRPSRPRPLRHPQRDPDRLPRRRLPQRRRLQRPRRLGAGLGLRVQVCMRNCHDVESRNLEPALFYISFQRGRSEKHPYGGCQVLRDYWRRDCGLQGP